MRRLKVLPALFAVLLLLSGCGTTGSETASLTATPIPAGKARVTIQRSSSILYAGAPATITLNGAKVADIATGGQAVIDVPAGANTIAASAWSYPGEYKVKLDAKPGARYALAVEPRGDSVGPGILLGPIGGAIDAASNENAGAFELKLVSSDAAVAAPAAKSAPPAAGAKPRKGGT